MSDSIAYDMAPRNGDARRPVVARLPDGREFRDRVDPHCANSRSRFLNRLADKIGGDGTTLQDRDDDRLVAAADAADQAVESAALELVDSSAPKSSLATQIVGMTDDLDLWHTPEHEAYASLTNGDHQENYRLRSRAFRTWLARRCHQQTGRAPGGQAIQDALAVLQAKALFERSERTVHVRLAEATGRIYLDLCDANWRAVELSAKGWSVVASPSVRFRRPKAMLPLPVPEPHGTVDELRRFVNVTDEDWPLLVAWLLAALRPIGPYPVLCLHGEQGSAKSSMARLLRSLVDPNSASLRSEPREPRDLMIAAANGWAIALDNVSALPVWLSDALCRLSTGGGFATRTLYEDDEETIFDAQRPIILNGIEELASRGDLLDRALMVHLPSIPEERRRPESELWQAFEAARPRILGALLNAVCAALRELPSTRLERLPRLADFALWIVAAESALGWPAGAFMTAYVRNRADANGLVLEASPVVPPLLELTADADWTGTATELWIALVGLAHLDPQRLPKTWPSSVRSLSGTLKRLSPNLRAVGVRVEASRSSRSRLIHITRGRTVPENCVTTVTSVTNAEKPGEIQCSDVTRVTSDDRS